MPNYADAKPAATWGGGINITGGGTLTTTEPPKVALIDDARVQIEGFITDVQEIAGALIGYGDATLGSEPNAGQGVGNVPDGGPRAAMLSLRLTQLRDSINTLRRAANRIHAI